MSVQSSDSEIEGQPDQHSEAPAASTPAAAPAAQAQAPTEASPPTIGNDRNIVLPKDAFNARLKAATEKGRKAAMAELDAKVRAGGFASLDEMVQFVAQSKAQQAQRPSTSSDASSQQGKGADKRLAKEVEKERQARENERKARIKAERASKQLEADLHALQAEKAIREVAIMAGVKDVDYAVELLQRSIRGKSEAELKAFDESKFFDDLRDKQPYLFGETVRPVTTGTGGKEPPPPSPGTVHRSSATNGQADAKKMSKQELDAHLQKMGLRPISQIV